MYSYCSYIQFAGARQALQAFCVCWQPSGAAGLEWPLRIADNDLACNSMTTE
jgi:hypothetical protein